MPTDDERRRVARNIRENYVRGGLGYKIASSYNIAMAVGIVPELIVGDIKLWNRLADLIEPSEPKVKCVAEVKVDGERLEKLAHDAAVELTGIDRDALLALADEMEFDGAGALDDEDWCKPLLVEYARRIREALGVVE